MPAKKSPEKVRLIHALRDKIIELVLARPEKAVIILTTWMSSSELRKTNKKAG